jgi:HK97 family phage major capsid protein
MSNIEAALSEKIAAAVARRLGRRRHAADQPRIRQGLQGVHAQGHRARRDGGDERDRHRHPADGGYFAPVEWDRTVTEKLKQLSPIRANAQVIQITTNGFSRVYSDGIVGSGWVGETAARPATTTPGLSTLAFNTGEIYANPQITQIALDDVAIDLEQWIADEVDREFAIQENIAFLSGNGTNKPTGILTYVTGAPMRRRTRSGRSSARRWPARRR